MTDDALTPTDEATQEPYEAPELDGMLQALCSSNRDVSAFGVTVTAGGTIITGLVIGRDAWLAKQAELIDPTGETKLRDAFANFSLGSIKADYPNFEEYYLHLEDARYISGETLLPHGEDGLLIRVRLTEIDAWNFGKLGQTND